MIINDTAGFSVGVCWLLMGTCPGYDRWAVGLTSVAREISTDAMAGKIVT